MEDTKVLDESIELLKEKCIDTVQCFAFSLSLHWSMVAICVQAFLNDVLVVAVVHIFMLRKCCVNIYYILHSFPFRLSLSLT